MYFTYLVLLIMPVFMSSNIIIGRLAINSVEPFTLAFLRWLLAFLIILPLALPSLRKDWAAIKAAFRQLLALSFLGMWICGAIVYFGLKNTSATNATLIYSGAPVIILLLEWLFRGRKIALREISGIVLALIGIGLIVGRGSFTALLSLKIQWGDAVLLGCTISWAAYSVMVRSKVLQPLSNISLFAITALLGSLWLLPFSLGELVIVGHFPATQDIWLAIAAMALIPSVLAFSCYQYGISKVGASVAGMFMYLLPPYGVGMAIVLLGEHLQPYHIYGFIPIMAGLLLATVPLSLFKRTRGITR
ncbi:DMT family transporter [Polycladidibacter stylochi]|uniref:DMT family transporter n=1 Tax=Polycladidibacter stylochi TaxID=1807766 RepID=UPI0009EB5508|nr:DMT family transporter [Pseudovibrio stylochi]